MRADLHLHSSCSDGALSPEALVHKARAAGLDWMALTDHDTLDGLEPAAKAAQALDMGFIPGVELGLEGEREAHLLVYGAGVDMAPLQALIQTMRDDRMQRMPRTLSKLAELSMPVAPEELSIPEGVAFSRPIVARTMVQKGYVPTVQEAFDRFLTNGRPAYVPRLSIPMGKTLRMLRDLRCVPVLAHPPLIKGVTAKQLSNLVIQWIEDGLRGIEAYHPAMHVQQQREWEQFAQAHGLMVTAGSDYHAPQDEAHGEIGSMMDAWMDASMHMERLLKALER